MTYFNKNSGTQAGLQRLYRRVHRNYMGTQMNVGLLVMEAGDTYTYRGAPTGRVAMLLFEGKVTYRVRRKDRGGRPPQLLPSRGLLPAGSPRAPRSP